MPRIIGAFAPCDPDMVRWGITMCLLSIPTPLIIIALPLLIILLPVYIIRRINR